MPAQAALPADTDVLVAGAGPVGLLLANFLGLYGVRTLVVEQLDRLIDYPRGVGMDDESLRSFQAVGLAEAVLPHTSPDQWMRFMTASGRMFASIEPRTPTFSAGRGATLSSSPWPTRCCWTAWRAFPKDRRPVLPRPGRVHRTRRRNRGPDHLPGRQRAPGPRALPGGLRRRAQPGAQGAGHRVRRQDRIHPLAGGGHRRRSGRLAAFLSALRSGPPDRVHRPAARPAAAGVHGVRRPRRTKRSPPRKRCATCWRAWCPIPLRSA